MSARKRSASEAMIAEEPHCRSPAPTTFSLAGFVAGVLGNLFALFRPVTPVLVHTVGNKRRVIEDSADEEEEARDVVMADSMPGAWPGTPTKSDQITLLSSLTRPSSSRATAFLRAQRRARASPSLAATAQKFPFPMLEFLTPSRVLAAPRSIIQRLEESRKKSREERKKIEEARQKKQEVQRRSDAEEAAAAEAARLKEQSRQGDLERAKRIFGLPSSLRDDLDDSQISDAEKENAPPESTRFAWMKKTNHQITRPLKLQEATERKLAFDKRVQQFRDENQLHPGPTNRVVKATKKPANIPYQWSPYHYEHGKKRPTKSVLRSSRSTYKPFEADLAITPLQHKFLSKKFRPLQPKWDPDYDWENDAFKPTDGEGDVEMDGAPPLGRTISIKWPSGVDWLTGEPIDYTIAPKIFYKELGVNEPWGPREHFENPRSPKPLIPDESSMLDTPKREDYDNEQEKSPEKPQEEPIDHALAELMDNWYRKERAEEDEDPDSTPSRAIYERWQKARKERELQEKTIFEAREKAKREEENRRWAEEERRLEQARLQREEDVRIAHAKKMEEEHLEYAQADKQRQAQLEEGKKASAERWARRRLFPTDIMTPKYQRKVRDALVFKEPGETIMQKPILTRQDFGYLVPLGPSDDSKGWLNDAIVDTMLTHVITAANAKAGHDPMQREKPAPYFAFNSAWFEAMRRSGPKGISRWAGKRGINLNGEKLLQAKKILFPVCNGNHWTVTVVDVVQRTIEVMNSLNNRKGSNKDLLLPVHRWLEHELGNDYLEVEWQEREPMTNRQENASDCGVFTILNSISRVRNLESFAMRALVNQGVMDQGRMYIASVLLNGGFTGEWELGNIFPDYEGDFLDDPNFDPKLANATGT